MENQVFVVPAQAGWFLLVPCWDGDEISELTKQPIIAWRVEVGRKAYVDEIAQTVHPVTPFGSEDDGVGILRPDGTSENMYGTYTSDEALLTAYIPPGKI